MREIDMQRALAVARHEAGHAWAAQCVGVTDFRVTFGRFCNEGALSFTPPRDRFALRIIGLAGAATDQVFLNEAVTARELVASTQQEGTTLSASDRECTGPVDLRLAEETLKIIHLNLGGIRTYAVDELARTLEALRHKGRRNGVHYR